MYPVWRQRRAQRGGELAHRADRVGVRVHGPHVEAVPQEERQVPAAPAAGVQHAPARVEPSAEKLIEEVDVDLAELLA